MKTKSNIYIYILFIVAQISPRNKKHETIKSNIVCRFF